MMINVMNLELSLNDENKNTIQDIGGIPALIAVLSGMKSLSVLLLNGD